MDPTELTVLSLIHDEVKGVRSDLKDFREELTRTRIEVGVLQDRSNRAERSARGATLWGKGGMLSGLVGIAALVRDLVR